MLSIGDQSLQSSQSIGAPCVHAPRELSIQVCTARRALAIQVCMFAKHLQFKRACSHGNGNARVHDHGAQASMLDGHFVRFGFLWMNCAGGEDRSFTLRLYVAARPSGIPPARSPFCEACRGPSRDKFVHGDVQRAVPGQVRSRRLAEVRPGTTLWVCPGTRWRS